MRKIVTKIQSVEDYLENGGVIERCRLNQSGKKRQKKRKKQLKRNYIPDQCWRELRYKAFVKYGNKCMCCGRSPKDHKVILHVDHIKPKARYPELSYDLNNLQILCEDCNLGKSHHDETDWR